MELVFNLVIGLILAGFFAGSFFISEASVAADVLGARGFPMIFAAIGLALLALSTLETRRSKVKLGEGEDDAVLTKEGGKRTGLVVALLLGYILLVTYAGFAPAMLLFIFFCVSVIGYQNWKLAALFAVLMTVLLVVVFGRIFFIALPRGVGVFKELSYLLY